MFCRMYTDELVLCLLSKVLLWLEWKSPPRRVELPSVNSPGRRTAHQVKLELRCTTKGRRDTQGASPPSLFLSLLLFPSCFSSLFSSPPPPPFLLLLLCLAQIWTSTKPGYSPGCSEIAGGKAFLCRTTS